MVDLPDIAAQELTGRRCGRIVHTKTGLVDMCGLSEGHDTRVEGNVPTHSGARSGIEYETYLDDTGKRRTRVTRWPDPVRAAEIKRQDRRGAA